MKSIKEAKTGALIKCEIGFDDDGSFAMEFSGEYINTENCLPSEALFLKGIVDSFKYTFDNIQQVFNEKLKVRDINNDQIPIIDNY